MFKLVISIIVSVAFFACTVGCEPIYVDDENYTEETITVECEVVKLYTNQKTDTETDMKFGYGYGYNSSGEYGMLYGMHPESKQVEVTEYYVLLADTKRNSLLFKTDAANYGLLSEGQEINLNLLNVYNPEGQQCGNTKFFWGDAEFHFVENVTEKIQYNEKEVT